MYLNSDYPKLGGDMAFTRIACFIDFSDNSAKAFNTSLEITKKYGSKLYVVHVLPTISAPSMPDNSYWIPTEPLSDELILEVENRMQKEYSSKIEDEIDYEFVVLKGHISTEILTFIQEKNVDLATLGAYGLTGMGLVLFGSVAKRISHKSSCSVLIVRERENAK